MCAYNNKTVSNTTAIATNNNINNNKSNNKSNNNSNCDSNNNTNNNSNKARNKNLENPNVDRIRPQKICRKDQTRTISTKSHTSTNSHISLKTAKLQTKTSYTACCITTGLKWKIILPTIILLLWRTSHVHAIRKGRLMTPSTFTALSGDLHVQIQFSSETVQQTPHADGIENVSINGQTTATSSRTISPSTPTSTSTSTSTSSSPSTSTSTPIFTTTTNSNATATIDGVKEVENIITSTLVISKYIDETLQEEDSTTTTPTTEFEPSLSRDENVSGGGGVGGGGGGGSGGGGGGVGVNEAHIVLHRRRKEIVQNIPVYPDPRHNVTQVAVPCQTFTRGGLYEMQVVTNMKTTTAIVPHRNASVTAPTIIQTTTTLVPVTDERLRQTLDVRWPSAEMLIKPDRLRTYPDSPVEVELRFPEVNCDRAWQNGADLPEFWLELIYCGKERSCSQLSLLNVSKSNILYAEQVRGYPKKKLLKLGCELFGLAGNYAVQLRPMILAPGIPITRRFLSVDWSDKFVFNVYARSIFPCDTHNGIGVLYEYPACILEQGDRVRVYAKLRADVASLKPPTSLHYVAEQRVVKSQYSLYFSCDLFTEKYVEYCFVYVSQAISGAVADVRMDCVPTLPVSESDTGGWGPWSDWTPCSTNCLGGTRNRYRFCDSPPPRYGAKFCEGPFVETEKCGQQNMADTWDCLYETSYGSSNTLNNLQKANRTEVSQEIGPGCRCGCIVHLGAAKPKRYIAGATQSCPGRSFWLIQVDGVEMISLSIDFLRLPCASQYIKVRDGPSLSSTLLVELNGARSDFDIDRSVKPPFITRMESTGAQLLVEFYAGSEEGQKSLAGNLSSIDNSVDPICTGGFLANVEQLVRNQSGTPTTLLASSTRLSPNTAKSRTLTTKTQRFRNGFTLVHLSAVIFASIIIIISALLGAQYIVRYRKYHLAIARRRDEGSRLHTPRESMSSLQSPPSRAMSTTTLLSEVICLVKLRPKHQLRHSILRESIDAENLALARDTSFNEDHTGIGNVTLNKCAEELGSSGSIVTLRNELSPPTPTHHTSVSRTPSAIELNTPDISENSINSPCGTLTRKDSAKDTESIISSGMSSICNSPPMNLKRLSKYSDRYDAVTLKLRNSHASTQNDFSDASMRSSLQQLSVSLTNGCYSPAVSIVSTATIRTTNPKEKKEKQNLKKLLARPGSEFSLGNQEELELDYYDYNVINAGAAPGSYLGMDPAYLIWIPPFEDCTTTNLDEDKTPEPNESTRLTEESDETNPIYEEIRKMPKYGHYLSPGSNSESTTTNTTNTNNTSTPTSDEISPLNSNMHSKVTTPNDNYLKNSLIQQVISSTVGSVGATNKPPTPYMTRKKKRAAKQQSKSAHALGCQEQIALNDLSGTKSARNIAPTEITMTTTTDSCLSTQSMNGSYVEKETEVVKALSGDLQNFLALDDIKFADENDGSDFYEAATDENETDSKHHRSSHENRIREVEV